MAKSHSEANRLKTLELCPHLKKYDLPGMEWQVFMDSDETALLFVVIDPKRRLCYATMQDSEIILPGEITADGEIVFPNPSDPSEGIAFTKQVVN